MGDPGNQIIGQFMLIGFLTLLNAFFAAAEMALVSVDKNHMNQLAMNGNKKAEQVKKLLKDPTDFLATIQVGITLAGFFSSASAATGIAVKFSNVLGNIPYANQISLVIITMILSYITLVFGELFPKRIAMHNADNVALFTVQPVLFISKITMPFVRFLSFSTNLLLKLTRMDKHEVDDTVTREDIKILARTGQTEGAIDSDEFEMIKKVIELDDTIVREIMIPRTSTFMLDISTPPKVLADVLLKENFTRIPIYGGNVDNIIGILHMKDYFLQARKVGFENVDIRPLLRNPYFVPETKYIDDLLKDLQSTKNHLAILIDEYGGFSGIATIEDLIEEIIGEIDDEHDEVSDEEIISVDENTYVVDGKLPIDDFNEFFKTNIEIENLDTIAGFILDSIGFIPTSGKNPVTAYENFVFTVEKIKNHRIERIKVEVLPEDEKEIV